MSGRRAVFVSIGFSAAIGALVWLLLSRVGGGRALAFSLGARRVELLEPSALYVLAALPLLVAAFRLSLVELPRAQRALSTAMRALVVLLLGGALARPSTIVEEKRVATVLLVDVSDSIVDAQLDKARAFIAEARAARRGDDVLRLVTFARRPRLAELPDDDKAPVPPIAALRHAGEGDGSDLAAALRLAYALYPPGTIRRAVLLTDGNETEGSVAAEAQAAARRGVHVDTVPLRRGDSDEILVRALRLPADVKIGQPFEVSAEIVSSRPQEIVATLFRDEFVNPLDGRKVLSVGAGTTTVKFRAEVTQAGFTTFRLALSGNLKDRFPANNQASAAVAVRGKPRVLYIEGEPQSAAYLQNALAKENLDVEVRGAYGLPSTARELARYDLVLLSDVASMYVGPAQMSALESYVKELGGGFIMAGGQNSFGSGGWSGTRMETLLPVRFETEKKRDQPQLALVLLIDKSGSMSGEKMELAKEAARATAGLLGGDDLLGVVGFDAAPIPVVRLQRAANRTGIQTSISRITASGGTNILLPLKMAYDELAPAAAKIKHVILLTDGQASYDGIQALVDEMAAAKITVSAVGVGPEADKTLLTMIAERGNGRFYHTLDAQNVPRIFTKETTQVAKSSLVEQAVGLVVARRAELLDGVPIDSAPALRGYVSTKQKPLSEVILATTLGEPLLARWRQGLGQVVAWTSDVKNRWAVDWLRWPGYGKLFAQLVRSTMRHQVGAGGTMAGATFELTADVDPPRARVALDAVASDDRWLSELDASLHVIDPLKPDKPIELPMHPTASGRYEADLALDRYGSYNLRALLRSREGSRAVVGEATSTVSLPYPREYLALPPDEALLRRVALSARGRVAPAAAALFDPGDERVRHHKDLWPPLLWLAAVLFLFDVALRRIAR